MSEPKSETSIHAGTSEAQLVNEVAARGKGEPIAWLSGREMEMTRRLIVAIQAFNASSDRWSRRLMLLTIVLAMLTLALVAIGVESAYLIWVQLERAG